MKYSTWAVLSALISCSPPAPPPPAAATPAMSAAAETTVAPPVWRPKFMARDLLIVVTTRVYQARGRSWDQLYRVRGDGSALRRLTDTARDKGAPLISRDGKHVVFMEYERPDTLSGPVLLRQVALDTGRSAGSVCADAGDSIGRGASGEILLERETGTFSPDFGAGMLRPAGKGSGLIRGPCPDLLYEHGLTHDCPSPGGRAKIAFRSAPVHEEVRFPEMRSLGPEGISRILSCESDRTGERICEHGWSPDGARFFLVTGSGGSGWWTDAVVFDATTGRVMWSGDDAHDLRWVDSGRHLLARVGNKRTRQLRVERPSREISVWASELQLFDVETGRSADLIPGVTLTTGYDVLLPRP